LGAVVRGRAAGRACADAAFFAGAAFLAVAGFFAGAAFEGAVRAVEAALAREVGAEARRRIGVLLDFRAAGFRAVAFLGAAFAAVALAPAPDLAAAAFVGAALAADFLGAALAAALLLGAAFAAAALAGAAAVAREAAGAALSAARFASSFVTVAEALPTWRCRRTSSARASFRSRSAFAIARSRACFAMVPPVLSIAGSVVEPGSDRRDSAPRRLTPRSPAANGPFIGGPEASR
jgi:hypothetical protein